MLHTSTDQHAGTASSHDAMESSIRWVKKRKKRNCRAEREKYKRLRMRVFLMNNNLGQTSTSMGGYVQRQGHGKMVKLPSRAVGSRTE